MDHKIDYSKLKVIQTMDTSIEIMEIYLDNLVLLIKCNLAFIKKKNLKTKF